MGKFFGGVGLYDDAIGPHFYLGLELRVALLKLQKAQTRMVSLPEQVTYILVSDMVYNK